MEMDSMIALIDMVQRKEFLSIHMIQKPAPTLDSLANTLAFRVMAKQQVNSLFAPSWVRVRVY